MDEYFHLTRTGLQVHRQPRGDIVEFSELAMAACRWRVSFLAAHARGLGSICWSLGIGYCFLLRYVELSGSCKYQY